MSAIRHDWLPLNKAASFLTGELKEEITEADILQLAWDGKLTLSAMLPPVMAITVTREDGETAIGNTDISGVWDIANYGIARRLISRRYRELTDIQLIPTIGGRAYETAGAVLNSPDGNTIATLTTHEQSVQLPATATIEEIKAAMEEARLKKLTKMIVDASLVARTGALREFVATRGWNRFANLTAIEKPDWEAFTRSRAWYVHEAMFLLLGALPVIGFHGSKPQFGLVVGHGDESTSDAVKRFYGLWEKLYRDVDEAIILDELPLIPGDEKRKAKKHDWLLDLIWDQEWAETITGSDGGARWEPIPPKRIGKDICLKHCRPADFLKWAESRGYEIPEELKPLLDETTNNKNETEPEDSGSLLNMVEPQRKDSWFMVIRNAAQEYEKENKITPSKDVLWARLVKKPPADYGIEYDQKKKELVFSGEKPLDKDNFCKRYARYWPAQQPQ